MHKKKDQPFIKPDGLCVKRTMQVLEGWMCDYFQSKRKNSKVRCRNCSNFDPVQESYDCSQQGLPVNKHLPIMKKRKRKKGK